MANTNGITYYKLDADYKGYSGDITKNCGLKGEEIDGNFNFLRGYDIEKINFDDDGNMQITRYNGDTLTATRAIEPTYEYNFSFDEKNGVLTIITPEGREIVLTGFKTDKDVDTYVYHDFSMEGVGTPSDPLKMSNILKSGRHKPANYLIDTTIVDENGNKVNHLPTENLTKNDRYVTKENISLFGLLYPLSGVRKIQERLAEINSDWRIPTKDDWDTLLNALECTSNNHDSKDTNVFLGEDAGMLLKSTKYWQEYEGKILSEDSYNFTIYPVGYAGNRGKNFYGSFGETSAFWTSSEEECANHSEVFVKLFDYKETGVGQQTWGENYHLSLRLVKDFQSTTGFNSAEDIDGTTVNCVQVPGQNLVWTKDNIAFANAEYDGFIPKEWDAAVNGNNYECRYFINDWNGEYWNRYEIKEGEGIVLLDSENGEMHEWLLVNGELIDSTIFLKNQFDTELDNLNEKIGVLEQKMENEETSRQEMDSSLKSQIDEEVLIRQNSYNELDEKINAYFTSGNTNYNELSNVITAEQTARENADKALDAKIDAISDDYLKASDKNELNTLITAEQNRAVEQETLLMSSIESESQRAIAKETEIHNALVQEEQRSILKENELKNEIDNEIIERKNTEFLLQEQINKNKVKAENESIVVISEENSNASTTIKVNIDSECEHIKLNENGIYFDGYFGQF